MEGTWWEVNFTPGAFYAHGRCQNSTSTAVDIVAGPQKLLFLSFFEIADCISARGLKSNSHQLASIAYRFILQFCRVSNTNVLPVVFQARQVKRECTRPVMTISIVNRCTLKQGPRIPSLWSRFFRETAMAMSTYLMPSFEEFCGSKISRLISNTSSQRSRGI